MKSLRRSGEEEREGARGRAGASLSRREKEREKVRSERARAKSNLHRPSHRWSLAPDKGQFSLIFVSFEYLH